MNKVLDTKSFILDDFLVSSYPLMRHHIPKQNPQLHYWKSLDFLCLQIHFKNPLNRQINKTEKRKNNNAHLAVRISGSYPSLRIFRVISSTLLFVSMNTILLFSFSAIISFNNVLSLQRNGGKKKRYIPYTVKLNSLITHLYKKNVENHEDGIHTLDGWTPKALSSHFMYLPQAFMLHG